MASLPIAAQLYTLREIMPKDVMGTLAAVAELGYDGVEFAGLHNTPPTKLRAELDRLGLKVCSAHVALNLFETELERTIDTYQILGCSVLVVPWIGEHLRGDFAGLGATLNQFVEPVRAAGMRLAYHNHDFELRRQNNTTGLDILLETTDLAVNFELTGMKMPEFQGKYEGTYVDLDLSATVNITNNLGASFGWRKLDTNIRISQDFGDLKFSGFWFGGAIRY